MTADLPSYRTRFVQLTALWAYGISQPLFVVINGNPDLVLSRSLSRFEVALFAVVVAVVPPALAIAYLFVASRLSRWVADVLFLMLLGAFLAPLVARLVKPIDAGALGAALLVTVLALAGVVLYTRYRAARLFLAYSIVLPVAGLVWFVHGAPSLTGEAAAAGVRVSSPVPVVLLVLDELPASSLMTPRGNIDAVRYPGFGRLARDATWYPNATTVHEWTSDAVPSLLTGRIGRASSLPTVENHPKNLFTLLGGAYAVDAREYGTRLCPEELCPRPRDSGLLDGYGLFIDSFRVMLSRTLPRSLSGQVIQINFDIALQEDSDASLAGYEGFLGGLSSRGKRNRLFYSHVLLPHAPWRFLPSGAQYDPRGMDGWLPIEHWADDPWPVLQGFQRHLLQVGYVDRLVARLLRRLEKNGLYDRAMVVVVADHGASFRAGQGRRPLTGNNLADITNVPMFVKYPKQRRGVVDPRPARTIDLLPTIADVIGVRLPSQVDGSSLLGPLPTGRDVTVGLRGAKVMQAPLAEMFRDRRLTLARKYAAFGEGRDSLYRIGENRWLLGQGIADFRDRSSTVRILIDGGGALTNVRRGSGYMPVRISGHVASGRIEPGVELAVAVNGQVEALTHCFQGDGTQRFRALVPEKALRDGVNEVEVFAVRGRGRSASVVWLGSNRTSS